MSTTSTPEHLANLPEVDASTMRSVLGHFATGVIAITAFDPSTGQGAGLAANSFTSVSLDPPLVAFCVAHTSSSWPAIKRAETFVINILAEDQEHVGRKLAVKGGDKFAGLAWNPSPSGAPIVEDAVAWIEARVEAEHTAGDHVIVVSRVLHLYADDRTPLLFHKGKYGRLHLAAD
ncbi:flavin reductase family protein [Rhodococcus sp. T2V]|uniref:flavin reductase family protein n=1 Tax=Rhodococcus sp. T2V TaxID=3034164 RepID=UPI0023E1CD67|nr:flavin reductase family protein [Rhodococcus sp. T2V]MDF3308219.1 flavin reductase family protein [Rhodococcus sp. T2V]